MWAGEGTVRISHILHKIEQLGKREAKREEYKIQSQYPKIGMIPYVVPWSSIVAQTKLNEQEVPELFNKSDSMKQMVEIIDDEDVLQTTTCPKDVEKDPKGWYTAFDVELDSFRRLDVMVPIQQRLLDLTKIEILPCKVVMVKKPNEDGTNKKKGRVVVCGNFQMVQPGEETCANTPSFPMLRTLICLASLYRWAVESWDVSTAFLYAPLIEKRDVYCRPPQVLVKLGLVEPGIVWKLKRALYGLRTSPRAWEEERDKKLAELTCKGPNGQVGLKQVCATNCDKDD